MGKYANQHIPTIYREITLGSSGFIFRTVDYEGSIKFQNNIWVFDPPLTVEGAIAVDHNTLSNIGTNTHVEIDTHIESTSNPHSVTKTQVGLGSVENTALSTWAGSSAITTLGTVGTGSWNATTIPVNKGGTGQTTASAAINTLLPSQAANNGKFLTTNGTAASWATVTSSTSSSNVETASNIESLSAGTNLVTFTEPLTSNDYDLQVRCYNVQGDNINYRLPSNLKTTDGFTISVAAACIIEYRASVGNSLGSGTGTPITANDDILNWDPSNFYYTPYTSKQSGLNFYTGTESPDGSTRLNVNGYLYATKVFSNGVEITNGSLPESDILSWGNNKYSPYTIQQSLLSLDTSSTNPTRTDRLNINGNLYATNINTPGTSSFKYLKADITATEPSHAEGTMYWDTDCHTLNIMPDISGCIMQVGQELWSRCLNNSGVSIPNGAVVYVTGSTGDKVTIALARANSAATSLTAIGVATETIANGNEGFITILGEVRGINTTAYTAGTLLYLSSTSAGEFSDVRPEAPNSVVSLGIVKRSHGTEGIISVQLRHQPTIELLSNVLIDTPVEGQVLTWDATNSRWCNRIIDLSVSSTLEDFYIDEVTSGTSETDLYSFTVPANTLASNGDKLIAEFVITSSSTSGNLTIYFAGTTSSFTGFANTTEDITIKATIIRTSATEAKWIVNCNSTNIYGEMTSKNWTTTNILKLTGTASSGVFTARMGYIEYKPASV